MYELQLIGHITKDVIICDNQVHTTLGAMANLWEACENLNPSLKLRLCPVYFGKALIFQDSSSGNRYSKANLNDTRLDFVPLESTWHHIFYLNHLTDTNFITKLKGIISVDICAGGKIDYDILKHVDYLFIADEDLEIGLEELSKLTKGHVICHSNDGSITVGHDFRKEFKVSKIDNLNVLGAGDYFAISFIINMLKNANLNLSIEKAHLDATNYLLKKNNIVIQENE